MLTQESFPPDARRATRRLPASQAGRALLAGALVLASLAVATPAAASQTLRGSHRSMDVQNQAAREHDFTFTSTTSQVQRFVSLGLLVRLEGNADYEVHRVSFPYARPEVRTFIRRLAGQYRNACGRKLVVTSLTRPQSRQPYNASSRSVHPTGMAVDFRRSNVTACRAWVENVLLYLEERGVLEATRESHPPHYHVAIFPKDYARYVAVMASQDEIPGGVVEYQVREGDSLWEIAGSLGVTVTDLRTANRLASDRIYPGQRLQVPVSGDDAAVAASLPYRVRSGDSLWQIARAYETTVTRIREENDLPSDQIFAGQVLTVPVGR